MNEWEDFLLVLNEIRGRDKDLVKMYRKKHLFCKNSMQSFANEQTRKTIESMTDDMIEEFDSEEYLTPDYHACFENGAKWLKQTYLKNDTH